MGEQAEAAVITPAMLQEEEQLEAAGLEQERQMLEKVRGGSGAAGPARRQGSPRAAGFVWGPAPCSSLGFKTNKREGLLKAVQWCISAF